jgi:serum/glucocorticoid-regulated kinase 2
MYNLRPKSFGTSFMTFFNRNAKVKKVLPLIYVEIIIYSETGDEFVVSAPKDYDFHYSSTKRNEVIDYLFFARKLANCGNVLKLAMQPIEFLRTYTLHPSEKASGKQRVLESGVLPISHDEFEVNFCGKKMISENLMPTGNNVTLQDFEFLSMLGVGGFSKVYLSKMKKTNELFAIKSIRLPEKKDNISHKMQIQHERDILVQISHPNIVKLKYAFQSRKRFFLVMPFVQGGELLNYIKREGNRVNEKLVQFYGAQIALALQYLHKLGIVYGDLKPENILVDKYGYIKLTDFGASKMLNGKNSTLGFAGTADYLAPEVLKEKKITKASDWWTFGILLYKMLFGQTPFYHEDNRMMFKGILNGTPIFPKKLKVSDEIKDLISMLLRKKSEKRLGSKTDADIFNHPWWKNIDFTAILEKKLLAPILPNIENESS